MNTNTKTLSIVSALALGLSLITTAPSAFAQVSQAQIHAAFAQTRESVAPATSDPAVIPSALSRIIKLTNVTELTGPPSGATLEQGVVQTPVTVAPATPVADPRAPKFDAALPDLVQLTSRAEMGGLPSGATLEQGVVQMPATAVPRAAHSASVATARTR